MKTLLPPLLLLFAVGFSQADQASDSFFTGFSRSLQAAVDRQNQAPAEPEERIPNTYSAGHYDVMDNYGNLGVMNFATYNQCYTYLDLSRMYKECVWIDNRNE